MNLFQYTVQDVTQNFNQAKEIFIDYLLQEKMCSEDQAKDLRENIAFVIVEKGMLGRSIDRLLGLDQENSKPTIKLVKLVK